MITSDMCKIKRFDGDDKIIQVVLLSFTKNYFIKSKYYLLINIANNDRIEKYY